MLAQTMIKGEGNTGLMVKSGGISQISNFRQGKRTRDMITSYLKLEIPYKTFNYHYGVIGLIRKGGSAVTLRAGWTPSPSKTGNT